MTATRVRAYRVPVADVEPLIGDDSYDYADAFEVRVPASDGRSSEEFARFALEEAPWTVRETVWLVHRYLLRLQLGPRSSPEHVLGWPVLVSEPDVVQLRAESPLLGRGVIVGRRLGPTRAVVTTYLFFTRPALARPLWRLVGPLHRRVAAGLMTRAAASAPRPSTAGERPGATA
jgi:hypothetical protein